MTVKISELNNDVSVATLISSGGTIPVVASNLTTGNLMTYQVSLANLRSFITTPDITYSGNVTVQGTLFAPNQTTVTLTSVSSTNNLINVQTDSNLVYPNVTLANNLPSGLRIFYVANATANSAALVINPATNYLTWWGSNVGNTTSTISANSILGTMAVGDMVVGNSTSSDAYNAGALRVAGGLGLSGNLYSLGIINTQSNIFANSLTVDNVTSNITVTTPIATVSNYITADKLIVNTTSTLTGSITTASDVVPAANNLGSLGNVTNYYQSLFSGNGYIDSFVLNNGDFVSTSANTSNIGNTANWIGNTLSRTIYYRDILSTAGWGNVSGWTAYFTVIRGGVITANANLTAQSIISNTTVVASSFTSNGTGFSTVSGNIITSNGNISAAFGVFASNIQVPEIIKTGSNLIGNIGQTTNRFNTVHARATSAQYADLAEIYRPDTVYDAGTVVIFGGSEEITVTNVVADCRVAGAISTNPAYLMNGDEQGLPLALRGKVPVKVIGPVSKGDMLVTANTEGYAVSVNNISTDYNPNAVFARSLEDNGQHEMREIWAVIL